MRKLQLLLTVGVASLALIASGCGDDDPAPGDPDAGTTDQGGTDEGGTDEGGTDEGGPDEGGPDEGGPDEGGPDEGTPDQGPDEGTPDGEGTYVTLTFAIDDSANMTYDDTDGLAWKGSFSYDSSTNMLTFDGAWGGPFVPLYDDGPISAGGHEPEDATAGDGIWSVAVLMESPAEETTLEYGAIRGSVDGSDGDWIWTKASNGTVTVPAGSTDTIAADGLTIAPFGWVDIRVSLNSAEISEDFTTELPTKVELKGSAWGWQLVELTDDGDGWYHFVLSENLSKHSGLLNPGDEPEFVFQLDDIEYKLGGIPPGNEGGVYAAAWVAGEWVDQEIVLNDKNNTIIVVPETPNPNLVAINFTIDDSANKTYDESDGLAWKGSFSVDAETMMMTFDGAWGGPFAVLYDDGPWNEGGHEPAGAVAGDSIWGVTLWMMKPEAEQMFEYGAIRGSVDGSDGDWIWNQPSNGTFTVMPDSESVTADGMVIDAFGTINLRLELDTAAVSTDFIDPAEITKVEVKGSAWGWQLIGLADDGTKGDAAADDGIYTFLFSEYLGKHDGLLMEGDQPEFVYQLNDIEYKLGGVAAADGVSAWSDYSEPGADACNAPVTGMCMSEEITINEKNNTIITVGAD